MKDSWILVVAIFVLVAILFSLARYAVRLGTHQGQGDVNIEIYQQESVAPDAVGIVITAWHIRKDFIVNEVRMPNRLFVALDARTPKGFSNEELPVKGNDEERQNAAAVNRESVRWVGRFAIKPNTPTLFLIPATSPDKLSGKIEVFIEGEDNDGKYATRQYTAYINSQRKPD